MKGSNLKYPQRQKVMVCPYFVALFVSRAVLEEDGGEMPLTTVELSSVESADTSMWVSALHRSVKCDLVTQ